LRFSATIQADREMAVAFKTSGYVATIPQRVGPDGRLRPLQAGDAVAAGTVLARLREDDYRERLIQADSAIREIEAAHAKASLDLARADALFDSRSLTKPDLDAAQAGFDAAVAQLTSARANAELARLAVADAAVIAPMSGVITERRIETGAFVTPGAVAFVIARVDPVAAVIGVPDLHLERFARGRTLSVTSDALPGRAFTGTVTSLSPVADDHSRLFAVEIALTNGHGHWRPGMIAAVEIANTPTAAAAQTGIAVPLSAIVRSGAAGGYGVFVVDDSGAQPVARARRVDLGDVRGNAVMVASGLRSGEAVVTSGPGLLVDGERIRIIP
jgi:RND family efflux transporter MFP subunit